MSVQLTRRRFTVDEYDRMLQAGILTEDDRVELIDGEIVEMAAIGPRHAACVERLSEHLATHLRGRASVRTQNPVRVGPQSQPEPDIAVVRHRVDYYARSHPTSADTFLLIEVAGESAASDRAVKIPLYARAGIPEVWLVDLPGERVEVYRRPLAGGYRDLYRAGRGEQIVVDAFPGVVLSVEDILG